MYRATFYRRHILQKDMPVHCTDSKAETGGIPPFSSAPPLELVQIVLSNNEETGKSGGARSLLHLVRFAQGKSVKPNAADL